MSSYSSPSSSSAFAVSDCWPKDVAAGVTMSAVLKYK
eukprot:CAMPEP_0175908694 /NCGR_PEP_ID=MMETSP0108-20121206/6725_1 /TAXON_ID=195067 ORGANISM="Goniomonas pacifica, Strain CCMP1869" /NCGR_SAMPLE_ID=MMETSP0108 /ASSEMBLY_ACC=CAM_ASM_000204 /LENGTH=36 /DNA_ID= /DNA_START= /DNA_END= /DNA_ORIENTATION=